MRFFITGIGGFVGVHLAEHLLANGHDVTGSDTARGHRPALLGLASRHPRFRLDQLAPADVTDRPALERTLADAAPDGVFHLAAVSFPPLAETDPSRTFAVNVVGTLHVIDAARRVSPQMRVVIVGSSDAYGAVRADELPVVEDTPLRPVNAYGISKAAADMAAFQRWWTTGAAVIRVRAFNHTGPGQDADYVCSDFARQVARMQAGAAEPVMKVGNLAAVRDFSDVRDIVRGYLLLWERGTPGEAYNLCSGVGTSIAGIIDMLEAESGLHIERAPDHGRLRGRETPAIVGSAARAAALGWSPAIPLRQTLRDLLDDWRARLAAEHT